MSIYDGGGKAGNRRPSLRGKVMFDITNGQERARAWPKPRGPAKTPSEKDRQEWFRQAQWATKYWEPRMQYFCAKAVAGTALLPRDLMTMIMAGRAYFYTRTDGTRIYSFAMVKDVSESLDVIGQTPGDILFRGPKSWLALPGGEDKSVLTYDGPTNTVFWGPGGGGAGGGTFATIWSWDHDTDGNLVTGDYDIDVTEFDEVIIIIDHVTKSSSTHFTFRFKCFGDADFDNNAHYFVDLNNGGGWSSADTALYQSGNNSSADIFTWRICNLRQNDAPHMILGNRSCLFTNYKPITAVRLTALANYTSGNIRILAK